LAYIADRSSKDENTAWNMLRLDEAAAAQGDYAEVAQELENAQADYAAAQMAKGARLKIVAARDKASGRSVRFTTYKPH
jgi:hypothetical protein